MAKRKVSTLRKIKAYREYRRNMESAIRQMGPIEYFRRIKEAPEIAKYLKSIERPLTDI